MTSRISRSVPLLISIACLLAAAGAAPAVYQPPLLRKVGIDQKLNVQVPPDLVFTDSTGKQVRLGDYFGKKPLILALVYYKCPNLCTMVLNDITRSMNAMKMTCGDQFDILTVSFDPRDTPADAREKKAQYLRAYRRPQAVGGWHFLTGKEPAIKALTSAVGFRYVWDPDHQQFVHASGLIILSPAGKTMRYFYGIDYAPSDLELSLAEASGGKSVSVADRILLFCCAFDPSTGRYTVVIWRLVQIFCVLTVLVLGSFILVMFRRDKARRARVDTPAPQEAGQTHD